MPTASLRLATDITFFDWPVGRERRGTHAITRTGLRVPGGSLAFWRERFRALGVTSAEIIERDGRQILDFEDPEGQRLSLVSQEAAGPTHPWARSPVPGEHQILGLGPIRISVPDLKPTDLVLTQLMGMRPLREYQDGATVVAYEMGGGGPAAELHVAVEPGLQPAQQGAGGVHHVAFRIPDGDYADWADRLKQARVPSSGPVDRFWFKSLYFREPNGILFEIATDGPGFATDEPVERLGESLSLPPFLEARRSAIEANLKPLGEGTAS